MAVTGTDEPTLRDIIDRFRADGVSFLTPYGAAPIGPDSLIDISHEALIRCWQKIADEKEGWLQREFQDRLIWQSLRIQAGEFAENREQVLSPAATADRDRWLKTLPGKSWTERYDGGWHDVRKLMAASRKVAKRQRDFGAMLQRDAEARAEEEKERANREARLARDAEEQERRRTGELFEVAADPRRVARGWREVCQGPGGARGKSAATCLIETMDSHVRGLCQGRDMAQEVSVIVSDDDRVRLEAIVKDRNHSHKHVQRAQIVLLSADRLAVAEVARRVGVSRPAVWRWQRRFAEAGATGLLRDKTRPPGTPPLPAETVARVVAMTCAEPPGAATHWTGRAMAKEAGISLSSVQRIWAEHDLQPHRIRTFKRSNDPAFAEKLRDIVGLYVEPPAHSLVLSVDEKSQIQALDRTQPGLPLKPGKAGTWTHDYKRHGTTTLFAALNVLDGRVIGRCMARHRHQEFIRFLNAIEREVPAGKVIHVILDNYAPHKHPKVRAWLARHPRWTFHFTPTSGSWLNAVETFFSTLTRRRLRRGVFRSIVDLQAAINRYLAEHNQAPSPFTWTRSADAILDNFATIPASSV